MEKMAIEGELSICRAEELKRELLPLYETGRELEIDLSGVTEMDGAGLQLMVAMKIEAIDRDVRLSFTGHSAAVMEVLDLADLVGFFGDPVLITRQ